MGRKAAVTETVENENAEKATRKPVDVGEVTVTVSERTSLPKRASKLDANPVAQAVQNAQDGKVVDLVVDPDKVDAVLSVLVRAGTRYERGIQKTVDRTEREDGKVVVSFVTGPRRERKAKADAVATETETTDEPRDENVDYSDYQ